MYSKGGIYKAAVCPYCDNSATLIKMTFIKHSGGIGTLSAITGIGCKHKKKT